MTKLDLLQKMCDDQTTATVRLVAGWPYQTYLSMALRAYTGALANGVGSTTPRAANSPQEGWGDVEILAGELSRWERLLRG